MKTRFRYSIAAGMAALVALGGPLTASVDVAGRPAAMSSRPGSGVMLDVTRAGDRLVAVGERGIVLVSDDGGQSWQQSPTPTSAALTRVRFTTPQLGWVVGHFGTVLRTQDGGKSWTALLDGTRAAQLALEYYQARQAKGEGDPQALQGLVASAQQLVDDGPDKPFLDVVFDTPQHGFIIGAYNLIFTTPDGGSTWVPCLDRVENPRGLHLYGLLQAGADWYIAGEQGLLLRSTDGAQTFKALRSPYEGTFFGIARGAQDELVAYGLRGNVFQSTDRGETWSAVDAGPGGTWNAASLVDGALYLGGEGGVVRRLDADHHGSAVGQGKSVAPVTGIAAGPNGTLVVSTMAGMDRIPTQRQ